MESLPKHSLYRHVFTATNVIFDDYSPGNVVSSNETFGFESNISFFAYLSSGAGGRVAVWDCNIKGRLPPKVPCFIAGSEVTDLAFDPFDEFNLITASEDGKIRLFRIPSGGLKNDILDPTEVIPAHGNKISFLVYHPLIKGLLLSASPDNTAKLFNLEAKNEIISFHLLDSPMAAAFDQTTNRVAVISKDKLITIFDCKSGQKLQQGQSHVGGKSARLLWLHGKKNLLLSVGFGNGSQREILVYAEKNLEVPIHTVPLDSSPSLLIPFYDQDTGVLVLIGKGETSISYYEIEDDGFPTFLNRFSLPGKITTAFSAFPKHSVDVANVEIIKGLRASQSCIENLSISVPRIKKSYFQDDVFSETVDFKQSSISCNEWLEGRNVVLKYRSLQPSGMMKLSEIPMEQKTTKAVPSFVEVQSESERKQASMKAMFANALEQSSGPLTQDLNEGVADEEWD